MATSPNRPNSVRNQSGVLWTIRSWRAKAPWSPMPTTGEVMRSVIDSSMIVTRPDADRRPAGEQADVVDAAVAATTIAPATTNGRGPHDDAAIRRGWVRRPATTAKAKPIQAERENVNSRPVARIRATDHGGPAGEQGQPAGQEHTTTSATRIRPPKALGSISSPDSRVPSPLSVGAGEQPPVLQGQHDEEDERVDRRPAAEDPQQPAQAVDGDEEVEQAEHA